MSRTASIVSCGPPALRSEVSWYGLTQTCVFGSGLQTVGTPSFIGIPSAPGNVPEVGVEGAVLLHHDHDVADLVNPPRSGRARLMSMARHLGRPEQQAEEEDACEGDDEEPLQSGRKAKRRI